jgi:TldD protein
VRKLVVLAVLASCAAAQSPLSKILSDELDRNFKVLKEKGDPAPYFMGYSVSESESDVISAADGAISSRGHNHSRLLDITVRVGTPKFDNYRRINGQIPRFTATAQIALEDNPISIRQTVWLATDRVYRNASQRLIQIKADEKLRAAATDGSDDFSTEEPQVFFGQPPPLKFNAEAWTARLRKLSAEFTKYPGALNSSVSLQAQRVTETLITTEGTRLEHGRLFSRIIITTAGKAADGMDLQTMESFETDDSSRLPQDAEILAAVEKAGKNLQDLLRAPPADPLVGPAILSGRAAGVFFHEIFGHRIEGHRQKDEAEGQTFTKSVGNPILPPFLSVVFDPTLREFQGSMLNGSYLYDDEGVKARRVPVVENGILKTFLMSRAPIDGFPTSNGHGRRQPGAEIVSRQSNLFVESSKRVSDQELRQMLIEEVKKQNKPYGLFFDQVTSGYTTTARRGLQAFTVVPLVVYRVYPDGRPDELIRGVSIVGTPLASFANIMATSDKSEVFNGICGAESGNVPVAAISPALLVSSIEIQRKERSQDQPPYLPRPEAKP